MQKITIKNFGPIENITDLEIPRVLFLIGPQASGKSTIAKLVYFFRKVPSLLWEGLNELEKDTPSLQLKTFLVKINAQFHKIFGKNKNIEIIFYYTPENALQIHPDDKQFRFTNPSAILLFFKELLDLWRAYYKLLENQRIPNKGIEKQFLVHQRSALVNKMEKCIKLFFGFKLIVDQLEYIPAGRSLFTLLSY
ncbi:MAG: hypothetical protein RIS64_1866 [Bacteroidota bacterium]|jgi:hypothetical protein